MLYYVLFIILYYYSMFLLLGVIPPSITEKVVMLRSLEAHECATDRGGNSSMETSGNTTGSLSLRKKKRSGSLQGGLSGLCCRPSDIFGDEFCPRDRTGARKRDAMEQYIIRDDTRHTSSKNYINLHE